MTNDKNLEKGASTPAEARGRAEQVRSGGDVTEIRTIPVNIRSWGPGD